MFNLGVLALERDELDEARQWFERALARSPQHVDALVNLGIVLQKQRHLDDAIALLPAGAGNQPRAGAQPATTLHIP